MTDRGEAIRFGGTIREIVHAPSRITARVGTQSQVFATDGELVVDVMVRPDAPPQAIRASVPGDALLGNGHVDTGGWSELVARSQGRLPAAMGQAFERGTVTYYGVRIGEPVEIYGEVAKREFADDGALREAPSSRVTAVRALLAGTGDQRVQLVDTELQRRYPPAQRPVVPSWFVDGSCAKHAPPIRERGIRAARNIHDLAHRIACALVVAIAIGCGIGTVVTRSMPRAVACYSALVTAVFVWPRPLVPHLRNLEHGYGFSGPHAVFTVVFSSLALGTVMVLLALGAAYAAAVTAVALVGLAIVNGMFVTAYANYRLLERAPAWDGTLGAYGAIEGIVQDPTPVRIDAYAVAIGRSTGYRESIGSNPDKVVWQRFHGDGTFLVATPDRGLVEVSPRHVVWATSFSGRNEYVADADYEIYETIPVDGKVRAVGWIEQTPESRLPQLHSRGTRPALLVATSPYGDPRDWIRRVLQARQMVTWAAFGLLAVGIAMLLGA